jgi:hypothetical protein
MAILPIRRRLTLLLAVVGFMAACATGASPSPSASSGGREWHVVDPDPVGLGGPVAVVDWHGGYVGVGGGGGEWDGQAWSSTDGTTWTASGLPSGGQPLPSDLVVTPGGLLAVGCELEGERQLAVVWTSVDGVSWTQMPADPDLAPRNGYRSTWLQAIVASPSGFVAVGTEWGDAGQHIVAWRSADGRDWVRSDTELGGVSPGDLLVTNDRIVLAATDWPAGGGHDGEAAMFWYSEDGGQTWARSAPSLEDANALALASREGVLVAVGYRWTGSPDPFGLSRVPISWTSSDGRSWTPATDTPRVIPWAIASPVPTDRGALQSAGFSGVAATADGFLAVGHQGGLIGPWVSTDELVPTRLRLGLWRSTDGQRWEALPATLVDAPQESIRGNTGTSMTTVAGRTVVIGGSPDGAVMWFGSE